MVYVVRRIGIKQVSINKYANIDVAMQAYPLITLSSIVGIAAMYLGFVKYHIAISLMIGYSIFFISYQWIDTRQQYYIDLLFHKYKTVVFIMKMYLDIKSIKAKLKGVVSIC